MAERRKPNGKARKLREALDALDALGFPRAQVNERSALTLLGLLSLKPDDSWADSTDPLMGITPLMDFFAAHYGKKYAPNTRETVRRHTMHQFVQAGLVIPNPDKPARATNSPKAVYQIAPRALALLGHFGTPSWPRRLAAYLREVGALKQQYARKRQMQQTPLNLQGGRKIRLSPGAHSDLIRQILQEFCPRYTPAADIIYVGDTSKKWAYYAPDLLRALGITVEEHGKMPDVVVYDAKMNWLVLVEAVTSHGPVNPKRRQELKELLGGGTAGIVYVTAFMNRRGMTKYLGDISWETEVWIAEDPEHMVHFNGERFLGPYEG